MGLFAAARVISPAPAPTAHPTSHPPSPYLKLQHSQCPARRRPSSLSRTRTAAACRKTASRRARPRTTALTARSCCCSTEQATRKSAPALRPRCREMEMLTMRVGMKGRRLRACAPLTSPAVPTNSSIPPLIDLERDRAAQHALSTERREQAARVVPGAHACALCRRALTPLFRACSLGSARTTPTSQGRRLTCPSSAARRECVHTYLRSL